MDIYRLRKNAQRCTKAEMQQICASAVQKSFPLAEVEKVIDRPTQTPLCGFTFATQKPLIKASL